MLIRFSFIISVLLPYGFSACSISKSSESIPNGAIEIKGTFYIDRNFYAPQDLANGLYHNSEIVIKGNFELPSDIQKNLESDIKPRLFLQNIQNTNFRKPVSFGCDNSQNKYSFETRLNKNSLKDLPFKLKGDTLRIKGWYVLPGDTIKRLTNFILLWDEKFSNEFVSLASGEIEEELGVPIDRKYITTLQLNLNHPEIEDYLHLLPEYTGIKYLKIQGTRSHEIPRELFKLKNLDSVNISELYNLDVDYQPDKSVFSSPIVFPMQFLKNPSLRSMSIEGARIEINQEFPTTQLKALYFKSYILDSLPNSFLNLKDLEIIDFNGQIEYFIPENLSKLKNLKVLKLCLPMAVIPRGFGPWPNLEQLFIYPAIDTVKKRALLINNSDLDYLLKVVKADTSYINGEYFYK